jgi:hypothetical protein
MIRMSTSREKPLGKAASASREAGIDLSDDILHGDEGTFARRHC